MLKRNWAGGWAAFRRELHQVGGFISMVGLGVSTFGLTTAAPYAAILGATILVGGSGYLIFKGIPPRCRSPSEVIGAEMAVASLDELWPQPTRLGVVGYTQSGKTTFIKTALYGGVTVARTSVVSASVIALQTSPISYVALIDGDGEQFAQQFDVAKFANILLVFVDHRQGEDGARKSSERIADHDRFLRQLEHHMRGRSDLRVIHLLLNKRDLWQGSQGEADLLRWFEGHVEQWKRVAVGKSVTSSVHSNFIAEDIGSVMRVVVGAI